MTNTVSTTSFETLNLAAPLMQALAEAGYTVPTPIQAKAIPPVLAGRDLLGLAETGTGKTAAFALPLLHRLAAVPGRPAPRTCRALILAPTRELAIQIGESIATYGKHLELTHTVIFGGVGARPQMRTMERGVDIIVATPGRLLDLIDSRHVRLDQVTQLILDEADRMLDMGFIHDVRKIVKMVPKVRQTLMFSATMPNDIAKLAGEALHDPVRVEIAHAGKTVDRITQLVYHVQTSQKRAALPALLQDQAMQRVIVFARTKRGADRVARTLQAANIPAHAIHGNKSQNARQDALEAFRNGRTRVLVATDIAARGIDIDDITHVVNYELPNIPESYVHRIGRTARAGATGIAIALCAPDERPYLRDIERLTRHPLTDAGKVEGIEAFANLPEPKNVPRDDDAPHFKRGKAKIEHGRRNNRAADAPTQGVGRPPHAAGARPHGAGDRPHSDRPAGDRRPQGGGDRGRPEGRGDRPFQSREGRGSGDRPYQSREARGGGDRPQGGGFRGGERPRSDRPFGDRPRPQGDRPRGDRPEGAGASDARGERRERPFGDRASRPQGDRAERPRGDFKPRTDFKPRDDRRPAGDRPHWKKDGDRPAGAHSSGERRFGGASDGPRRSPHHAGPRRDGEQAGRTDGGRPERRDFSRDDRGSRPPRDDRGARPSRDGGDRPYHAGAGRPFEKRGEHGGRPQGGGDRKPYAGSKPGFKGGAGAGPRKPWEERGNGDRPRSRGPERANGTQPASASVSKPDGA